MKVTQSRESGQIMILMALAIVALLGFAALAIDVGMVYADRRAEQNAADSAVLSGMQLAMQTIKSVKNENFQCNTAGIWVTGTSGWSPPAWLTSALLNNILSTSQIMAQKNGYVIEQGFASQNGVAFRCGSDSGGNFVEVRAQLTHASQASFLQIFGRSQLVNTVESISRGRPSRAAMGGFLVYVLDPNCGSGGIDWRGTVDAYLFGGGAFTRSCLHGNGNTTFNVMAAGQTTSQCKNATGTGSSGIGCNITNQSGHSDWCDDPKDNFLPNPNPGWASDPLAGFSLPNIETCSNTLITSAPADKKFSPGTYQIDSKDWDGAKLKPGLYCIKGSISLQGNGAAISSIDGPGADGGTTHGVTVYMIDGGITCTGNCEINLRAVAQNADHKPADAIPGLVLMSKHGNTSTINWGGNSGTQFAGTVYVPDGPLDLGGTGDIITSSQFIARSFKSHGNSQLCVKYDANMVVTSPADMEQSR